MKNNQKGFYDILIVAIIGGFIGSLFILAVFLWHEIEMQKQYNRIYTYFGEATGIDISANSFDKIKKIVEGDPCKDFDQQTCYETERCVGIFGSSYSNDDLDSKDWVYHGCRSITDKLYDQAIEDKVLCEDTKGIWNNDNDKILGFCNCTSDQKNGVKNFRYFLPEQGCQDIEFICDFEGGVLYDVGELECSDLEIIEDNAYWEAGCDNEKINSVSTCICPDGMIMKKSGLGAFCE